MTTHTAVYRPIELARIERLSDLQQLEADWRDLESRCSDLTVFSTWEWCSTVAEYYVREKPLWVFTMREGGELVGLAPLAQTRLGRGLRVLRHIGCGLGLYSYADYQDLLIADSHEGAVAEALCDGLERASTEWDVVHLQELPHSSRAIAPLLAAARKRGWRVGEKDGSDVHPLPLPESWDAYRRRLSTKTRKGIERRERKLMRERGAEFIHVEDEGSVDEAMEVLFDLHTRRWASVGKPGIFRNLHWRRFHQEMARRLHRRGALRLTLLKVGGQPIASAYSLVCRGVSYCYAGGFSPEPEWFPYRIGTVMDAHEIRRAIEEGLHTIDFLRGDGEYKDHYRTETCHNRQILMFRNLGAQLHYLAARVARGARGRLRRMGSRLRRDG